MLLCEHYCYLASYRIRGVGLTYQRLQESGDQVTFYLSTGLIFLKYH